MSLSSLEPRYWIHWARESQRSSEDEFITTAHRLRECSLFSDAGLAILLLRHPKKHIRISTMGHDLSHPNEIQLGEIGDTTGTDLLQLIKQGRFCVRLYNLNAQQDALAHLSRKLGREFDECVPGASTVDEEAFLEISSPKALDFLRVETLHQACWQIRGKRVMNVFPSRTPIVAPSTLDAVAAGEHNHPLYYEPAFDQHARIIEQSQGQMATCPALQPFSTVNADETCVVLTTRYQTHSSKLRTELHRVNLHLRRFIPVQDPDQSAALGGWLKQRIARFLPQKNVPPPTCSFFLNSNVHQRAESEKKRSPLFKADQTVPISVEGGPSISYISAET